MFLINGKYLNEDFQLVQGDIEVENGRILRAGPSLSRKEEDMAVDCQGYTIVPGFIDVHIHGCAGADTGDGTRQALEDMARFLLSHGVTSFCPTTATVGRDTVKAALLAAKDVHDHPSEDGAKVAGVNMEGPFFSHERKGAQNEEFLLAPDFELFQEWYQLSGGLVRLIDLATEQPGGEDFVKRAKELCTVSIAHTTAKYEDAKAAFDPCHPSVQRHERPAPPEARRCGGSAGGRAGPGRADLRWRAHPPGRAENCLPAAG